jgi:hypothetical protein
MDHAVEASGEGFLENLRISYVALDEIDLRIGMGLKVDHPDLGARTQQIGHHVAADEAGSPGDQDPAAL